ncbi:MAG: hypothetical protein GVY34_05025 [Alphaproteobacteria bacterium]|nr:hypothetical protein [Alphaproteobacteria bacterium]
MEHAVEPESEDATDPLLRMARRNTVKAAQQGASFQAALSQALGRMCAGYAGLDGVVTQVSRRSVSLAELVDLTEPGMFLALLEGPDDQMGMMWLCPATLAALIEVQTTGQVFTTANSPDPPRLPTRTDAALVAPMIDSFLQQISARCAELPEATLFDGFMYGSFLDDRRPIGVVLDDIDYELVTMQLSLAQGRVSGTCTLVLPQPAAPTAVDGNDDRDWERRMSGAVENSAVSLNAVLCRFRLTLAEALALTRGDVLQVPESTLETLGLTAMGGAQVASGRLGQARGFRAVRLTADPGAPGRSADIPVPTLRFAKTPAAAAATPPQDTPQPFSQPPSEDGDERDQS